MTQKVRFLARAALWRKPNFGRFVGNGQLHFQEIGVVADGRAIRVRLPLIDYIFQAIISAPCIRTIPYSAITSHRPGWPWGLWSVIAIVLLVCSLMIVTLSLGLIGENSTAIWIAITTALVSAVLAGLCARPIYDIHFRNSQGKIERLRVGVKNYTQRRLLADDLERHIEAFMRVARQHGHSSCAPSRRTESTVLPSPDPSRDSTARASCVDCFRCTCVGASAGLFAALVMHLILSTIFPWFTSATNPLATRVESMFYRPGRQILAAIWGITNSRHDPPEFFQADGAILTSILLVTIAGSLVGIVLAISRSNGLNVRRKTALTLEFGLILLSPLSLTAWIAYSLNQAASPVGTQVNEESELRYNPDTNKIVKIIIDPDCLQAYGLELDSVRQVLAKQGVELKDEYGGPGQVVLMVERPGNIRNARQLDEFVVGECRSRPWDPVRVREIANVREFRQPHPTRPRDRPEAADGFDILASSVDLSRAVASEHLGKPFGDLRQHKVARAHFDKAITSLTEDVSQFQPHEIVVCYTYSAVNLLELSRWGEALAHADLALEILDETTLPDEEFVKPVNQRTKSAAIKLMLVQSLDLIVTILFAAIIAWNAGRLGFSAWIWLTVSFFSGFPLAALPVLASLPDPQLEKRRQELNRQLSLSHDRPAAKPPNDPPAGFSIGDESTFDPST